MPSGQVHTFTTMALAGGAALAAYQLGQPFNTVAALAGGTLAGLLLSPDLDVNQGSISMHHAKELGGWGLGLVWSIIWKPYSWLIPHRSPLSHFPIIGTAIRLLYLAGLAALVLGLLHISGVAIPSRLPGWVPWAVLGLVLADALHFVLDNTFHNSRRKYHG